MVSRCQPNWRHSRNEVSGKPGTVHMVSSSLLLSVPTMPPGTQARKRSTLDTPYALYGAVSHERKRPEMPSVT